MRLDRARKLKPGTIVLFGNHSSVDRCTQFWRGEVVHVTLSGGVKVKVIEEKPWGTRSSGEVRWVPYHHIIH